VAAPDAVSEGGAAKPRIDAPDAGGVFADDPGGADPVDPAGGEAVDDVCEELGEVVCAAATTIVADVYSPLWRRIRPSTFDGVQLIGNEPALANMARYVLFPLSFTDAPEKDEASSVTV
jgi:hypothetical protein